MKLWTSIGLCLAVCLMNLADAMISSSGTVCFPEHVQSKFCNADFVVRAKITSTMKIEVPSLPTPPRKGGNGRDQGLNNQDNNSKKTLKELIDPIKRYAPEPRRFARSLAMAPAGLGYGAPKILHYLDVKIKRVLRGNVNRTVARVYAMDQYIGMRLKPNKSYLLAGKIVNNKLFVSSCSWYTEWQHLGLDQLRGIKKDYLHGCRAKCRVLTCFFDGCEKYNKQVDVCMWRPDDWSPVVGTDNDCKVKHSACRKVEGRCQWKHSPRFMKCKKNKNFP